jgi:signal transduction histidine kinase
MAKLKTKLAFFNLLSKMAFTLLFLILMPFIVKRITLIQEDNNLIEKREQVLALISKIGIEPFIVSDTSSVFGNYNIFKEEFISIEKIDTPEDENFIEITSRIIEGDEISFRILDYTFKANGIKYRLEVGRSLSSIQQTESNVRKVIWLFLFLIIIITYLTDLYYNGRLLRPLDKITGKLKGTSDPATFDRKPIDTDTTDFIHLDSTLTELMDNLDSLFKKEKEITVNISHELLTPVSVLRSNLENLLIRKDLDTATGEKIEECLKTLYRLQSLINSLLLIARLESRQYLREESFSVNDLLSEIVNEIKPVSEDKEIAVIKEFTSDFIFHNANRSLSFSMFYNIINNAVKNTADRGTITIKSHREANHFIVIISDTGKGMTSGQLEKLFSRFKSRVGNEADGTGIGLAIAKSIADFHDVVIKVDSEVNKGTIFSFILPENS